MSSRLILFHIDSIPHLNMPSATIFRIASVLVLLAVSGCAYHHAPYAMYEGTPELSNTSVFAAVDEKQTKQVGVEIQLIDGKEPSCWQVGCPIWARVLPGTHKFLVRYSTDFRLALPSINYRLANLEVEVKDMKPRHVYVARYRESGNGIAVYVEDLGENPEYGVWIGLEGANRKYHRVGF